MKSRRRGYDVLCDRRIFVLKTNHADSKGTPGNFYTGGLDRASHLRRDDAWIAARAGDPASRYVPVWRGLSLIAGSDEPEPRPVLLPPASLLGTGEPIFLGYDGTRAFFAVDLSPAEAPLEGLDAPPAAFIDLRRVGPVLSRREGSLLAYARGMVYWRSRHLFCGVCGSATTPGDAGHVRRCTDNACGATHFPRTDPAVIMLVHDGGSRCLLGRQKAWAPGMYSTLAGFVEPGESLEEAVAREVYEETRVVLETVSYHSSQPWPFPASLMLGFHAKARSTAIEVDKVELEDARWFEKSRLLSAKDGDGFRLPRADSIARRLVEDWLKT